LFFCKFGFYDLKILGIIRDIFKKIENKDSNIKFENNKKLI